MKQFQIFRYLKRWRFLIVALMFVGGIGFYSYATDNQTYTANVVIEYTNAGASNGLRPDGQPLDVNEIFSSKVITSALEKLGFYSNLESIRSNCGVTAIIPEDEDTRRKAILDKGDEYEYFATDYLLQYTAGASSSADSARRMLSTILDCYFEGYAERYISETILPDNASNLIDSDYDYIEKVDLLRQNINDIMYILDSKRDMYGEYRSAQTGFSFDDLYCIYEYIYDNTMNYLYAQVLDNGLTKNASVLTKKYKEQIEYYQRLIKNNQEKLDYVDRVIGEYGAKIVEKLNTATTDETASAGNVLQSVYGWREDATFDPQITYDDLLYQRIDYQLAIENDKINMSRAQDMLKVFENSGANESETVSQALDDVVTELGELHVVMSQTFSEFNDYLAAENLRVMSNVTVYEGLNTKLYLLLTVLVFFVCGCVGAVVLGRGEDIMEFLIYHDSKTGLPNRVRCDHEIAKYENTVLHDNFTCAIVTLDNLRITNDKDGYAMGNIMLRQLGLILTEVTRGLGFIGYNNSGQYLCLFEDCTTERADALIKRLGEIVAKYNTENKDMALNVSAAAVCTTDSKIYDIKSLVREVYKKLSAGGNRK